MKGPLKDCAICDPDETDLKRMFALYLDVPAGAQRDYVERAIAYICEKNPEPSDRAKILLGLVDRHRDKQQDTFQAAVLPLLGRLGTDAVYQKIQPLLHSPTPELSAAAVRAFCNWPTAQYADALWDLAAKSESPAYRSQALRAYIRVVTLPSDRPEAETLGMLKNAMKLADSSDNKCLALSRAASVRTLATVDWIAAYLDDRESGGNGLPGNRRTGAPPFPASAEQGAFRADSAEGRSDNQGQVRCRVGRKGPAGNVARLGM